jgi:dUTPase
MAVWGLIWSPARAVVGPLPSGLVGRILGQSGFISQGIIVLPGIIDSDYIGNLQIMVTSMNYLIPAGTHLAHLLLLPDLLPKTGEIP